MLINDEDTKLITKNVRPMYNPEIGLNNPEGRGLLGWLILSIS
jgi:hypothetical protein